MGYQLGVDLGTTYTAAAIHRDDSSQITELGNRTATIPSVVFLTEDEQVLTGEAANRRAVTQPDRVAREFKRRIGDPTPLLLGGSPYSAEALSAQMLRWVIQQVTDSEGSAPDRVAVTHPANWGPYKLDLLRQAFRMADLDDVVTLTEPEAAAIHYSTLERIEPGMTVAVFDLGGGTFDAAVLRKTEEGFDFLGHPEGIERLGGIDFDEAVFGFVTRALGGAMQELDPSDPTTIAAVSRLRRDCVDAKEALSNDTEVTIPVVLPTVQTDVRLTRAEFEQLIRPSLADTIGAMQRAVRGAGLEVADIDLVLLVGGSSRIPLVGQMVGGELGRPVAIDAHPKHSIALGAALAAATQRGGTDVATAGAAAAGAVAASEPPATPDPGPVVEPEPVQPDPPAAEAPAPEPPAPTPAEPAAAAAPPASPPPPDVPIRERTPDPEPLVVGQGDDGDNRRKLLIGVGAVVLIAIIAIGAIVASGGGGDDPDTVSPADEGQADPAEVTTTTGDAAAATTTEAPAPTTTTSTTTTTTTTTEPPFECPQGFCAHIEDVTVDNGELVIEWTTHGGWVPDTANFHAHFYYNVYDAVQVGSNWQQMGASNQAPWQLTQNQPFLTAGTAVAIGAAPAGTTAICVVPAASDHGTISPENAECWDLPPELIP